ncbi:MAG: DUF6263 family protein [Bacteroidota bacterium]|nr:DUF6263 family protein [Bacteroidota bacterium]
MKKLLLLFSTISFALFCSCGSEKVKESNGKIRLQFSPEQGKAVKINYTFEVTSLGNGDHTQFEMLMEGKTSTNEKGVVQLEMTNKNIKLKGTIQGKAVNGDASIPDSLAGDAKLVSMSVFAMMGKTYRSTYGPQLDKYSEVQMSNDSIVDSTENKMQILIRYPEQELAIGDTWEKQILIKSSNKMNCAAKYKLTEIKNECATVTVEGKLYGNGDSFGNEFSMEGNLSGTFIIDIKTGWPVTTDVTQKFTLKMGGKDIPMKYVIKSSIE